MSARATATAALGISLNYADNTIAGRPPATPTPAGSTARRRARPDRVAGAGPQVQLQLDAVGGDQAVLARLYRLRATTRCRRSKATSAASSSRTPCPGSGAPVGAARSGSSSSLHHVVGVGPPGGNMEGAMKYVIGGWQWTGVMQFQTGRPYTVTSGTDNSLDGIGNDRAKLTGVSRGAARQARRETVWFNAAAFAVNDRPHVRRQSAGARTTGRRCTAGTWGCSRTSA